MEDEIKEISKVKVQDVIYDLKDEYVRKELKKLLGDDYDKKIESNEE